MRQLRPVNEMRIRKQGNEVAKILKNYNTIKSFHWRNDNTIQQPEFPDEQVGIIMPKIRGAVTLVQVSNKRASANLLHIAW